MNPKYYNFFKSLSILNSLQATNRKASNSSVSIPDAFRKRGKGNQKLKASESLASSISNLHRMVTGAQDLTKVLLTDDYFSDVNPRSMRRLMNIVYITGNIISILFLKAFLLRILNFSLLILSMRIRYSHASHRI